MKKLLVLLLFCLALAGCNRAPQPEVNAFSADSNLVSYARGFTLQRNAGGVVTIRVRNPWDSLQALATYYLVRDPQTPVPDGGTKVTVPLRRVVPTSTTHYEPLSLLGEVGSVVGICNPERTFNPIIRQAFANGDIRGLGDNFNLNREVVLTLRPDALFVSRYSATDQYLAAIEHDGNLLLYNQEWQENTLLGRAEWIKFFGAFFDKLDVADSIFCQTANNYNQLKTMAEKVSEKPKIMSGCGFHGTWYVPGGQSYMADLYRTAGGAYAYGSDSSTGSLPLSLEAVLTNFADADFWFGVQENTLQDVHAAEPRTSALRAYKTGQVFNFNRRSGDNGSTDFWEGAISHPDWLLADVMAVLHPELLPRHQMVYLLQVEK